MAASGMASFFRRDGLNMAAFQTFIVTLLIR
jgi:hypothetical protein